MPDRPRLLRIAHRGASGHCPENTRAAFLRAIELGADMVELDCQNTLDGAVVVIHDETLERTTNGRGRVRDHTLKEIKALDAGSWFGRDFAGEEVLTLEEAVEILRGRVGLNLEIKGHDAPGRLEIQCVGIVRSLRVSRQTVFSSFSPPRMRLVRDLADDARIGVLGGRGRVVDRGIRARRRARRRGGPRRALARLGDRSQRSAPPRPRGTRLVRQPPERDGMRSPFSVSTASSPTFPSACSA